MRDTLRELSAGIEMLLMDIMGGPFGIGDTRDPKRQFPADLQMKLLGIQNLNRRPKKSRHNLKGLDIGCGEGALVEKLREMGYDFEGLDDYAPDKPYFMRQCITAMHPSPGCIPKPDESYDLVVAHQNGALNSCYDEENQVVKSPERIAECVMQANSVVYEGYRVLKPGGRFIIFPCTEGFESTMVPQLSMQGIPSEKSRIIDKERLAMFNHYFPGRKAEVSELEPYYRITLTKDQKK